MNHFYGNFNFFIVIQELSYFAQKGMPGNLNKCYKYYGIFLLCKSTRAVRFVLDGYTFLVLSLQHVIRETTSTDLKKYYLDLTFD